MIYDYSEGFNNAQVIVADSGRMKISADKQFLILLLFEGKMFKNFNRDGTGSSEAVPYMKESFKTREMLIRFDSDFHRADESILQDRYIGKNLADLQSSIDSMTLHLDSIKQLNARAIYRQSYRRELERARPEGDTAAVQGAVPAEEIPDFDRLYRELPTGGQASILRQTKNALETTKADYDFKAAALSSDEREMRRHHTEMHQKFTLSFACLIFFFIGAPLGAIIRKGGLGMPVVISVFLFIFYYVINNIGLKMASNGMWQPWQGMWLSSAVLLPLGVFLTYKASNDSVILNADTYIEGLKKLIGKRATRKIERKEVIMFHVDYTQWEARIERLKEQCEAYLKRSKRWMSYFRFWEQGGKDPEAERISVQLEELVAEGTNSDRHLVLNKLMDYPILNGYHLIHFRISPTVGKISGWLFPIGLPIYLLATYRRKLLLHDIRTIAHVSNELLNILKKQTI